MLIPFNIDTIKHIEFDSIKIFIIFPCQAIFFPSMIIPNLPCKLPVTLRIKYWIGNSNVWRRRIFMIFVRGFISDMISDMYYLAAHKLPVFLLSDGIWRKKNPK